jgi:outer membrane protein OmpA-like peptidoglycan-associated protein
LSSEKKRHPSCAKLPSLPIFVCNPGEHHLLVSNDPIGISPSIRDAFPFHIYFLNLNALFKMRKQHNYPMAALFAIMLSVSLTAQSPDQKHGVTFKHLFINHIEPFDNTFDDFSANTMGAELAYIRNLRGPLNLAIPFKMGSADLMDETGRLQPSRLLLSLDALLHLTYFRSNNVLAPYALAGIGASYLDVPGDAEINPQVPIGAGLNIRMAENFYAQLQYEYRLSLTNERDNDQIGIGIAYIFGGAPKPKDKDGDGLTDDIDKCPEDVGTAALQGCPDSDSDGIANKDDKCPLEAGIAKFGGCPDTDKDGVADNEDGCPAEAGPISNKGCPLADQDKDGIVDAEDNCPLEAGLVSNKGCPITDRDGDGVPNDKDECPDTAGTINGCPDTDGDGVVDKNDKCPTVAGLAANGGCPEMKKEDKETLFNATRSVEFETAQATLKTSSTKILDEIADIMNRHPAHSLTIAGHTDSVGDAAANQKLSESRAKSCYDYLVRNGVTATRMSYAGYGETKPVADNKYKEGRDKNRRVEFNVFVK